VPEWAFQGEKLIPDGERGPHFAPFQARDFLRESSQSFTRGTGNFTSHFVVDRPGKDRGWKGSAVGWSVAGVGEIRMLGVVLGAMRAADAFFLGPHGRAVERSVRKIEGPGSLDQADSSRIVGFDEPARSNTRLDGLATNGDTSGRTGALVSCGSLSRAHLR
jgi:hypothetical protein